MSAHLIPVLRNAQNGRPLSEGYDADHPGFCITRGDKKQVRAAFEHRTILIEACRDEGLVDLSGKLTKKGAGVLAKIKGGDQ